MTEAANLQQMRAECATVLQRLQKANDSRAVAALLVLSNPGCARVRNTQTGAVASRFHGVN